MRQYARAYERLDANAARAVWPTVDVRALSRAFDGLASQEVTFAGCDVSLTGADARATCHGTTTYVPRVGSKDPRTLQRNWVFRLRKTEGTWSIAQAETR